LGNAQEELTLTPAELYQGNLEGRFKAIVDVRTVSEWRSGHIENATFVANLASTGSPKLLEGCDNCVIAIYCRSGARARGAIRLLQQEFGYKGDNYDGFGVSQ
jgi:rhodanese-related sulfurtransferase